MRGYKFSVTQIEAVLKEKYPSYIFDFSNFTSTVSKISMTCPLHGTFHKFVYNLLRKDEGCIECKKQERRQTKLKEAFIKKAREIHGNKYEYPGDYIDRNMNMTMICPIHGEFHQHPSNHLRGSGCKQCGLSRTHNATRRGLKSILEQCKTVHNNFYEYNIEEYKNKQQKIEIICPIHGIFKQKISAHLRGQRCPKCAQKMSKVHLEIENLLKENGIEFKSNDRSVLGNLELDIIIPDKKIAIEINGAFWHREGLIPKLTRIYAHKKYHLNKTERCEEVGWRLIHIFDYEWAQKKDLVTKKLKHLLNIYNESSIFARKCTVSEINSKVAWPFLEENHIQGRDNASIRLGLFHKDELVGVMTFLGDGNYKLSRFATKYNVPGAFSKLLSFFEKTYKPQMIETFADRRFSKLGEDVYTKNGFTFVHYTDPAYHYYNIETGEIVNRQAFMRHKLYEKYPEYKKMGLSEKQIAINLGFDRIYDCGHIKLIKKYI